MSKKGTTHAIAGVLGLVCISSSIAATVVSGLIGAEAIALAKNSIFTGMFVLILALLAAGASGVGLLGTRTERLALRKQKRGPVGFMTSLFVLLPASFFLSKWAAAQDFDGWYYGLQTIEIAASSVVFAMVGLNIRDGLALRGRIAAQGVTGPVIDERDGGPLVVSGLPALVGSDGKPLAKKRVTALCRCGASKTKPYCDGSHSEIGFDTAVSEERTKDEVLVYDGEEISIHYNRMLCSHAAECGRRQKAAFDSSRKPWIVPDNAAKQGIIDVVRACPSGALRFSLPGGQPEHRQSDVEGITIEKNGPYRVSGVPLASGCPAKGANPNKYVLCRCGASKNKPFCDGSHYDIGWTDSAS